MTTLTTPLQGLADRLTAADREAYAGLVSYFASLPEGDELFHLAQLLGLLSLLGQRLPDALAQAIAEVQEMSTAAGEYHARIDARLAELPKEILAGVDTAALTKTMAEAFRQQIAATGLAVTAETLRNSSREIAGASGQIAALKPLSNMISTELTRLTAASDHLQHHTTALIARERNNSWLWQALLALVLFLGGVLFGLTMERR